MSENSEYYDNIQDKLLIPFENRRATLPENRDNNTEIVMKNIFEKIKDKLERETKVYNNFRKKEHFRLREIKEVLIKEKYVLVNTANLLLLKMDGNSRNRLGKDQDIVKSQRCVSRQFYLYVKPLYNMEFVSMLF